jgi:hypothetical protein
VGEQVELPAHVSHGSVNAYINYRCRCELCRQAHSYYRSERLARDPDGQTAYRREYMRKYRALTRKRQERPPDQG